MSNILFLITHFSLKRQNEVTWTSIFLLENTVNQMLFYFLFWNLFFYFETYLFWTLLVVLRHPHQRARWVISDWTVLEVNTQERRLLEQTDQWLTLTFRWKLNKQRCVRERMSILSISFNIVTVVYGINLKILMSHNNSFQNCPMYGVACQC